MVEVVLFCLAVGLVAGLSAGMFGIGGGLVVVPALVWIFGSLGIGGAELVQMAIGTSLATIVVTATASTLAHQRHGVIDWPLVGRLVPGLMAGAAAGALWATSIEGAALARLFGLFELVVALYMALGSPVPEGGGQRPGRGETGVAGVLIGAVSALLGIGGGTLMVPYLSWRGVAMRRAVAVSAACGLPIAVAGAGAFFLLGAASSGGSFIHWPAFFALSLGALLFAPVGAGLAHRLPVALLRRLFALLLALVGASMAAGWR